MSTAPDLVSTVDVAAIYAADHSVRIMFEREDIGGELRFDYDWHVPLDIQDEAVQRDVYAVMAAVALGDRRGGRVRVGWPSSVSLESVSAAEFQANPFAQREIEPLLGDYEVLVLFDGTASSVVMASLLERRTQPFGLYHLVPQGGGGWWGCWSAEMSRLWDVIQARFGPVVFRCRTNLLGLRRPPGFYNDCAPVAPAVLPLAAYGGGAVLLPSTADDLFFRHPASDSDGVGDLFRLLPTVGVAAVPGLPGVSEVTVARLAKAAGLDWMDCRQVGPPCGRCSDCVRAALLADALEWRKAEVESTDLQVVFDSDGVPERPYTWAFIAQRSGSFRRMGGPYQGRLAKLFRGLSLGFVDVLHQRAFDAHIRPFCPELAGRITGAVLEAGVQPAQEKHRQQLQMFNQYYRQRLV